MIVEDNTEFLNEFQAARIVTLSPHCFTTYNSLYPDLNKPVIHYTQLLSELLSRAGWPGRRPCEKIVYHDPCYLGKQGGVYDQPAGCCKR